MRPVLLFVHGWGFDARLWDAVRGHFAPADTVAWDLGFFGAPSRPAPPAGRPVIAIGHSFGALWLLHERPLDWAALVSVNGFSRFAARQDFLPGIAPRVLDRMRRRLGQAPAQVVAEFRALCGGDLAAPETPEISALDAGLAALEAWDTRPAQPDLSLCGAGDRLISPAMSQNCFPKISWHDGGHLLPLEAPDWVATKIREFLAW